MISVLRVLGIATSTLVIHLLLVAGGTCACLGGLVVAGHLALWRGLQFPVNLDVAARLGAGAAVALLLGLGLHQLARRIF
jgi:hypothetical protein